MDSFGLYEAEAAEETAIDAPLGVDCADRRAHLEVYGEWISLLNGRQCPLLEDMDSEWIEGPRSMLLELIGGEEPVLDFAGGALLAEAGLTALPRLRDVPPDSYLALLITHFRHVVLTGEPIAFDGEHDGGVYRGILLPLSSDGAGVDYVWGMINWREPADIDLTANIALEVGRSFAEALVRLAPVRLPEALPLHDRLQRELPLCA